MVVQTVFVPETGVFVVVQMGVRTQSSAQSERFTPSVLITVKTTSTSAVPEGMIKQSNGILRYTFQHVIETYSARTDHP